jgi:preprotein translocase subunit YajC
MKILVAGPLFAMGMTPDGGSPWLQLVPFVLVLAIFYFIILLKVGDRVITTGGIHGQVTRLGEQSIQLQIADKVRIEVSKAAIGGYQGQAPVVEPQNTPA